MQLLVLTVRAENPFSEVSNGETPLPGGVMVRRRKRCSLTGIALAPSPAVGTNTVSS